MTDATLIDELDHSYTDEIVCPYCLYEHMDSWEVAADSGDCKCHECGNTFFYERDIKVTYTTSKERV